MKNLLFLVILVLIAGFSRLIPHPWNFTAVGAMALFSGVLIQNRGLALLAPVLSLLWTDAVLGFHATAIYIYAAVLLITILGFFTENKALKIAGSATVGSVLFFMITNFGVWFSQGLYPMTWEGLVQCYVMAIPFYGNQLAGDLFYTAVLFLSYQALMKWVLPTDSSVIASNQRSSF